jgi:anti-sigma factor RsiW
MTCRQLVPDVIDHARGIVLDPRRREQVTNHLRSCASCAALAERHRGMSTALGRLAREQQVPEASDRQLQQLLASFDAPRARPGRPAVGVGLSLAASVLIVAGLAVGWKGAVPAPPAPAAAPVSIDTSDSAFIPLAGASALPRFERGEVIRVEIPSPEGAIQADVLVGQDGLARAVRLVQ